MRWRTGLHYVWMVAALDYPVLSWQLRPFHSTYYLYRLVESQRVSIPSRRPMSAHVWPYYQGILGACL